MLAAEGTYAYRIREEAFHVRRYQQDVRRRHSWHGRSGGTPGWGDPPDESRTKTRGVRGPRERVLHRSSWTAGHR